MAATELIKKTYRPSMQVGQVYARPYGGTGPLAEVGNVLELTLEHGENVIKQDDMSRLGGGVHAETRRVNEVNVSMKLADVNVVNLARATLGSITGVDAGSVPNEVHTARRGGLLRLAHIGATNVQLRVGAGAPAPVVDEEFLNVQPSDELTLAHATVSNITVKSGASWGAATPLTQAGNYTVAGNVITIAASPSGFTTGHGVWVSYDYLDPSGTLVSASGNYEVRPEGLFILADAADIADEAGVSVSYQFGDQAVIEALTTKAVELELVFGGLNEADGGSPCVVEIFRASQSVTKQLALINSAFGALDVSGSVLIDPTKTGVGISRYYKQTIAAAAAA